MTPDTADWTAIGRTGNADFFEDEPGVLTVAPFDAQSSGAQGVYRDAPNPMFEICFALVGGTVFGRAVRPVFLGLHPPRVPTRIFGTFEEAPTWIRQTAKTR